MTDQPRGTLCELIATYGRALCDDLRRCEALLRDLCGTHRREIHVLVSALRERVAADLLAASEGVPREVLRARLTQPAARQSRAHGRPRPVGRRLVGARLGEALAGGAQRSGA